MTPIERITRFCEWPRPATIARVTIRLWEASCNALLREAVSEFGVIGGLTRFLMLEARPVAGKRIVINLEDQKARDSLQRREFKKLANRFVKDIPPHASKAFEQFVPKLPSAAIGDMLRPIDVKWREQLRTSIENIQRHYLASSRGPVHFNPPNPMLEVLHRIDARMDRIGACLPSQSQPD